MNHWSRRKFLGNSATIGSLAFLSTRGLRAAGLGKADIVISGGTFHTIDPGTGRIEALAIRGERILAVGSAEDIASLIGTNTRVIDATGLTVCFHLHLSFISH